MDLDRRQFLKLGLAASASVAASGAFGALGYALSGRHVSRTSSNYHDWVDTVCRMCPAGCGIRAFCDKYGNLAALAGIPDHPVNQGRICAKGMAAINLHYHPERLLTPLIAGKGRGKGFDAIAYDDAIEKAADLIRNAKAENALFAVDTQDDYPEIYDSLLRMLGVDYRILSRPILERRVREMVDYQVYGAPNVLPDFSGTQTLLVIGANPFEGGEFHLPLIREITEARIGNRAKLIVMDPRNTHTAGRADLWLPVRPGTDLLACLLLLKRIARTDGPMPDGISEQDVFRITGIPEEKFAQAGKWIQESRPLTIIVGEGIYRQKAAVDIRKCLATLEGTSNRSAAFVCRDSDPDGIAASSGSPQEFYESTLTAGRPVFLITRRTNPVYEGAGGAIFKAMETPGRLIGHLAISPFGNETNRYADLLFPERIPLEDWDLAPVRWKTERALFTLQRPIPNPPPGLNSGYDVLMDISEAIGMKGVAQTLGRTMQERVARQLAGLSKVSGSGDFGPVFVQSDLPSISAIFTAKAESEPVEQEKPADETSQETKAVAPVLLATKDFPDPESILLITHDSNVMNDDLANAKWLSEISHRNALIIHPADAKKQGIRQGDEVRIEAHGKQMVASAELREGIMPGVVSLARGFGHEDFGKVAQGENWRTDDPDMWLIWWGRDGNGVNANRITSGRPTAVRLVKV